MKENKLYFKIAAITSFLLPLVIYAFTTCPKAYTEDCGEFITGAYTLSVIHPPGYPLYCMLGKVFSFIPIGEVAWRVNFMSGFFGALAGLFLFLLIARLVKNILLAFTSAMLFCFTPVFWSQCVVAEVYSLNIFFLAVCLYLLQIWRETKADKYLYLFSFVYGLSLTNHHFMTLAGPFFILFILWNDIRVLTKPGIVFGCIGLFVLGLLPYLYLPLASKANPVLNWGRPDNIERLIAHIQRKLYSDVGVGKYGFAAKWKFTQTFMVQLFAQFGVPLVIIGITGFCRLFKKDIKFLFLTAGVFIFNGFVLIFMQKCPFNQQMAEIISVYYFPCYLAFACWIGYGLSYIAELLRPVLTKHAALRFAGIAVLAVLICVPVFANYHKNDLSKNYYVYDYMKSVFGLMDKDAVFFETNDFAIFNTLYLQEVEGSRKDITMYEESGVLSEKCFGDIFKFAALGAKEREKKIRETFNKIIDENYGKRPVYFMYNFNLGPDSKYTLVPFGIVLRAVKKGDKMPRPFDPVTKINLRNLKDDNVYKDYDIQKVLSLYWSTLAAYYLSVKDADGAGRCYEEVARYDDPIALMNAGSFFLNCGLIDKAVACFTKALSIDPQYHLVHFNMAVAYEAKGDKKEAAAHYLEFYRHYKDDSAYAKYARFAANKADELERKLYLP